jgi:hypothetical protein
MPSVAWAACSRRQQTADSAVVSRRMTGDGRLRAEMRRKVSLQSACRSSSSCSPHSHTVSPRIATTPTPHPLNTQGCRGLVVKASGWPSFDRQFEP